MEAQTTVSNSTQCDLLIGKYKKYTVSRVTFSFNKKKRQDGFTHTHELNIGRPRVKN